MSDRQPVNPDDLIIDVLCEPAEDATREQWTQMIRNNTALENELAQYQRVLAMLKPDDAPKPDDAFQRQLWNKINAAEESVSDDQPISFQPFTGRAPRRYGRLIRSWPIAGLAAAIVLFLWVLPTFMQTTEPNVAWADVVAAFNKINSCHIIAFMEDPRSSHEERRLAKWEMYYRSPNLWRAQAFDHVDFRNEKGNKIYDAKARQFVERKKARLHLIPDKLYSGVEKGELLSSLLEMMFDSKDVKRTAVKNTQLAGTSGIEVFDYARDATHQWARVWVLTESRLPIHMKIYQPRRDEFYDVSFDYSDPQPAEFFDPDLFEKTIKEQNLTKPHEIMKAGIRSIAGKPVTSINVAQGQGPETMPQITRVLGVEDGSFMLETMPIERVDHGVHIERKWLNPTDNWGNVYLQVDAHRGISGRPGNRHRYGFVPVPPFKQNDGKRIITLRFMVNPGASAMRHSDQKMGVIQFPSVKYEVGFNDVSEIPNDIKRGFGSGWAKSQINSYLNATTWRPFAHERFVQLQTQLQTELLVEQRISALNEQYNLLKGYSRWQKAEKLMADTIIPLVVANDPLANQTNLDIITKHMLHLFSVGKYDQFDALVKVLVPLVDAFPKRTKSDRWVENRIKYQDIEFGQVMLMIKALQDQDEMELPKLVSSQRTTDGFVILEFQTPKAEYKIENDQTLTGYQMWQMDVSTGENMLTHLAFPGKDPRTIYVIIKTDMKQATLAAKFRLCNGNFYPHGEVRKSCPMGQIKLPTEPTIATSKQWWGEHAADKKLPFYMQGEEQSVYNKLNHQAFEALKEKDYQAALEVYEQLLALPKADWPEYMFTSWIYGAYLAYEWERGSIQSQIDKCQIRLGNHEQVLSRIKQELAQAPSMGPDDTGFIKPEVIWIHQHLRAGLLEWASFLIEQGKFDQAQTFLDDMAKDLPDLSKYLREYVPIRFHTPDGGETIQSCNPNWDVRRSWHPYEKTLWDLHDARKAQTVDKK